MDLALVVIVVTIICDSLYRYYLIRRAAHKANTGPTQSGEFWLGPKSKSPFSLLILGDSIGAASGISDFKDSVGGLLAAKIAERYYVHYLNLAKNGNTVRRMSQNDIDGKWDLIIVLASSNDLIHLREPIAFGTDLDKLLSNLKNHSNEIVFAGPGNVAGAKIFPPIFRLLIKPRQHSFNRVAKKIAAKNDVIYVPVEKYIDTSTDPKYVSSDKLHPNVLGHKLWFDMVWDQAGRLID